MEIQMYCKQANCNDCTISEGKLRPHISNFYTPAQIALAHEQIESGHTVGKIVHRFP